MDGQYGVKRETSLHPWRPCVLHDPDNRKLGAGESAKGGSGQPGQKSVIVWSSALERNGNPDKADAIFIQFG